MVQKSDFPNIRLRSYTPLPGVKLPYRLRTDTIPVGCTLIFLAIGWIICIGIEVWLFTWGAVPGAFFGLIFLAFVLVPLFRNTRRWLQDGRHQQQTIVEMAAHPVYRGQDCELYIAQSGPTEFASLNLLLACEEAVSYTQGTDTRTESKMVHCEVLHSQENLTIPAGQSWEFRGKIRIPDDSMHTFMSQNNRITWKITVYGERPAFTKIERNFPFQVSAKQPDPITCQAPISI